MSKSSVLFVCLFTSIVWVSSHPLLQNIPIQALLNNNCPHQHHQQQQQQNVPAQIQQQHSHAPCQQNAVQQHTATCQQQGVQQQQALQQQTTPCQQQQQKTQCQQQIIPNMNQILEAVLKNQIPMTNSHQQTQMVANNVPQGINYQDNRCPIQNQNQEKPQIINNYFVLPPELFFNGTKILDEVSNIEIKGDVGELDKEKDLIVNIEDSLPNIDGDCVVDLFSEKSQQCQVNNKPSMPLVVPQEFKKYYEMYEMIKNVRKQKKGKGNNCHCNGNKYGSVNFANNANYPDVTNNINGLNAQFLNPQEVYKGYDDHHGCHKNSANPENFAQPIGDPIDFVDESQLVNGNRKARTPADEAIIKQVKNKYPKLPEAAVRTLLSEMKRQLMVQQKAGFWNPYNGMMRNPFYPMMPMHMVKNNMSNSKNLPWYPKRNRHWPNCRKFNRNPKNKSKTINKNITEPVNAVNINQTSIEDSKKKDPKFCGKGDENSQLNKPKLFENTTPYAEAHRQENMPELGTENKIPNIDGNDIENDDYNPDLTNTFEDEDYYYDDDEMERAERDCPRNRATELRLRRKENRRKHSRNNARNNSRDCMKNLNVHDARTFETIKDEETIVFKIPPGLETPDFQTVKVNKDDTEYYDDYYPVFYKITLDGKEEDSDPTNEFNKVDNKAYDEMIAELLNEEVQDETTVKPKPDKIETSHANSKIADYSHKTEKTLSGFKEEPKRNKTKHGDTTLVMAKTVKLPDSAWRRK